MRAFCRHFLSAGPAGRARPTRTLVGRRRARRALHVGRESAPHPGVSWRGAGPLHGQHPVGPGGCDARAVTLRAQVWRWRHVSHGRRAARGVGRGCGRPRCRARPAGGHLRARCEESACAWGARPFSPHVTLARIGRQATPSTRMGVARRFEAARLGALGAHTVAAVSLFESDLSPAGRRLSRGAGSRIRRRRAAGRGGRAGLSPVQSASLAPQPPPPGVATPNPIARLQVVGSLARNVTPAAVAADPVPSATAWVAAAQTPGTDPTPLGHDGHRRRGQHFDLAHDAVAAAMRAGASGARTQGVTPRAHRIGELKRLDGRVQRVGHGDVDAARSRPRGAGPQRLRQWSRSRYRRRPIADRFRR